MAALLGTRHWLTVLKHSVSRTDLRIRFDGGSHFSNSDASGTVALDLKGARVGT